MQKNDTYKFISIMHHAQQTTKGGKLLLQRLSQLNKPLVLTQDLDAAVDFAYAERDEDCYICLNDMRGNRRSIMNTHAITGVYIDLDKHPAEDVPKEIADNIVKTAKERSYELIMAAVKEGTIPEPTMITETRRGYGVYYIYEKPLAHTVAAGGLIKCHDYTCKRIMAKFQGLLSSPELLEVDKRVTNKDRLCRVVGTYACGTDFQCRLVKADEIYYSLTSLREGFDIKDREENPALIKRSYLRAKNVIDLSEYRTAGLVAHRLDVLDNIVTNKVEKGILSGYRELYLFWTYNYLAQVMPEHEAIQSIKKLNAVKFGGAVTPQDIDGIIKSVRKKKYKAYNETLQDQFDIVDIKDAEKVGLGLYQKKVQREAAKRRTKDKKDLQKALISEFKPLFKKREQLLAEVNKNLESKGYKAISMKTLDRRIKELELNREGTLSYQETAEYKREKERKKANAEKKLIQLSSKNDKKEKFPKNASVSFSPSDEEEQSESSLTFDFKHYLANRPYYEATNLMALLNRHDEELGSFYNDLYTGSLDIRLDKNVMKVISNLGYENRTRAINVVKGMYALYQNGELEAGSRQFLESKYGKPIDAIKIEYKDKTPEQKAHYKRFFENQQVWAWVLSPSGKTKDEQVVARSYQELNKECKQALADKRGEDEFMAGYSYATFKKKVLFYLSLDQLKQIAANGVDALQVTEKFIEMVS